MPRRLTPRQKNFADHFIKTGNQRESAQIAYNASTPESASVIATQNLNNPRIASYIESVLNGAGISDHFLAQKERMIIEASTTRQALKKIKPADGVRVIEMAHRLKDHFPAQRTQIDKREVSLKLQGKSPEELAQKLIDVQKDIQMFAKLIKPKAQIIPNDLNSS